MNIHFLYLNNKKIHLHMSVIWSFRYYQGTFQKKTHLAPPPFYMLSTVMTVDPIIMPIQILGEKNLVVKLQNPIGKMKLLSNTEYQME